MTTYIENGIEILFKSFCVLINILHKQYLFVIEDNGNFYVIDKITKNIITFNKGGTNDDQK